MLWLATDKWQLVVLSPIVCWSMLCTMHTYVQLLTWRPEPCRWSWTHMQCTILAICSMLHVLSKPNSVLVLTNVMYLSSFCTQCSSPAWAWVSQAAFFSVYWGLFFAICHLALGYILWLSFHPKSLHIICPIRCDHCGRRSTMAGPTPALRGQEMYYNTYMSKCCTRVNCTNLLTCKIHK